MDDWKAIVGKHWQLKEIVLQGSEIDGVTKAKAEIVLEADTRAHGYGGCNNFVGNYLFEEGKLKFGPMASTKMYCLETMAVEDAFLKAIHLIESLERDGERMVMKSEDGSTWLIFELAKLKFKSEEDKK